MNDKRLWGCVSKKRRAHFKRMCGFTGGRRIRYQKKKHTDDDEKGIALRTECYLNGG